jgi:hypothetical protein
MRSTESSCSRSTSANHHEPTRRPAIGDRHDNKIPGLANPLVSSHLHAGVGTRRWNRRSSQSEIGRRSPRSGFCRCAFLHRYVSTRSRSADFDATIPGYATRGENHFRLGVQRGFAHAAAGGNYSGISPLAPKQAVANMGGNVDDRERRLDCSYGRSEKESKPPPALSAN